MSRSFESDDDLRSRNHGITENNRKDHEKLDHQAQLQEGQYGRITKEQKEHHQALIALQGASSIIFNCREAVGGMFAKDAEMLQDVLDYLRAQETLLKLDYKSKQKQAELGT